MSGGERRLAFKRGDLNGTRENPAAYKKTCRKQTKMQRFGFTTEFYSQTGHTLTTPNYPGYQFEALFEQRWGVAPSGKFYNAYKLVKSFRDGMQKAIWINKGNPNKDRIVKALYEMSIDPESSAVIESKVGKYEWKIGKEGDAQRDTLMTFITEQALKDLVQFNTEALGLKSVYKSELVK